VVWWTLAQLVGYMRTWSATTRYVDVHGGDPIADFEGAARELWGDGARTVRWEYAVRAGY